ncbi:hypothetical protein B0H19DRAFT_120081 [Mycena capillaripes]|nr:hypothetical protein B0H19DRAFT_120081 [Mycena capillaripes]
MTQKQTTACAHVRKKLLVALSVPFPLSVPWMAVDTMSQRQVFQGIKYHISSFLPGPQQAQLRGILNSDGAHEVRAECATRIITDQAHFLTFQEAQFQASLVTPQWAFASIKAGIKQPSRYYSADPTMFCSSLVVSALGISPAHTDLIRAIVAKYGGQWEEPRQTPSPISSLTSCWIPRRSRRLFPWLCPTGGFGIHLNGELGKISPRMCSSSATAILHPHPV